MAQDTAGGNKPFKSKPNKPQAYSVFFNKKNYMECIKCDSCGKKTYKYLEALDDKMKPLGIFFCPSCFDRYAVTKTQFISESGDEFDVELENEDGED